MKSQAPVIDYAIDFDASQIKTAARLYDEAFGEKFALAIHSHHDRQALFEGGFVSRFAIAASVNTKLIGLAGLHTPDSSLTGGIGVGMILTQLGVVRGLWAIVVFSLYERKPTAGQLLMDGIAVHQDYRGYGIGTQLLRNVVDYARQNGFQTIRLDVIDTNPGARRLYERQGFIPVRIEKFPWLRDGCLASVALSRWNYGLRRQPDQYIEPRKTSTGWGFGGRDMITCNVSR